MPVKPLSPYTLGTARAVLDLVMQMADDDGIGSEDEVVEKIATVLSSRHSPTPASSITKIDQERRMVYGFVTVSTKGGELVVDRQDDTITTDEMRKMAHRYIGKRVLGVMHGKGVGKAETPAKFGEIRESAIFDADMQQALGIDLGREGWWIGAYVDDNAAWDRVKKGELQAFSIGGKGTRTLVEKTGRFLFSEVTEGR